MKLRYKNAFAFLYFFVFYTKDAPPGVSFFWLLGAFGGQPTHKETRAKARMSTPEGPGAARRSEGRGRLCRLTKRSETTFVIRVPYALSPSESPLTVATPSRREIQLYQRLTPPRRKTDPLTVSRCPPANSLHYWIRHRELPPNIIGSV